MRPILVTGATGNVGKDVVAALSVRGALVRAGVRTPGRRALPAGVAEVALDLLRPETFPAAVAGCSALFLLRPPAIANVKPTLGALVDAAASAGVEHVVFLSVVGADRNRWVPHHAVERHLAAGRVGWTFLRAGFFAQNLGDAYRRDVVERDALELPAGDGRVAFVDTRDLAEVAALALLEPARHRERAYRLTGGEAVTFDDVAAVLSRALGRPIRYVRMSAPGYLWHVRRQGLSWGQAAIQTILHVGLRRGDAEAVDPTLAELLGRPPRTIAEYVADHRAMFVR